MSCCPVGSEPALASDYKPKGEEIDVDGLKCYTVGTSDKVILVLYDIYGFNGGRTRLICDQLADAGYYAILPDLYYGDAWPADKAIDSSTTAWVKSYGWNTTVKVDTDKVLTFLDKRSYTSLGVIGFCYGAYVGFHMSGDSRFKCGASIHPSVQVCEAFGESLDTLTDEVKCPQLLYPAGGDPDYYKPGGKLYETLMSKFGDANDYKEFPEMNHGWCARGDLSKPEVARDVKLAMEGTIAFFKKHM